MLPYIVFAWVLRHLVGPTPTKDNSKSVAQAIDESSYYLNTETSLPHTKFKWVRASQQLLIGIVLWFLPLAVFYLLLPDFSFWRNLTIFFTKAAFVTFRGAYAVLPYVAQVCVEQFHWLTHLQMIDGLALGETTPGPLIMVLVFVGFMGGYNHFGGSLLLGSLALVVTTFYTFLPCFLFIFIGAPLVEQTQGNSKVKTVLGFVTAAVVGVLLNLTVYPIRVILPCVLPEGATICDAPGRSGPSDRRARGTKKVRPTFASHSSSMDKIFIHQWCRTAAWGSDSRTKLFYNLRTTHSNTIV